MSHSLSNKAARASAKKKLLHAFDKSNIQMEILPFWNEEYEQFKSEIKKANLSWLRDTDVDLIMFVTYLAIERERRPDGKMGLTHDKELLEILADQILDNLATPNEYWFYFPLPQIVLAEEIELSDSAIFVNKKVLVPHALLSDMAGDGPVYTEKAFLKVRGRGFVLNDRTQSAFVDALTKAKVALQIAALKNFVRRSPRKRGMLEVAIGGMQQADIHEIEYVPDRAVPYGASKVMLGMGLSQYFSELVFSEGQWNETRASSLSFHVGRVLRAFNDPVASDNVKSIRRSLEWAFDAGVDEDEHMRFIKTCIGLEAAISEQNEEIGITEQLADRCAFLLDKTSLARQETRNAMRQIYRLRSKLVHGVAAGLTGAERTLAVKAGEMLTAVLGTELKAVMEWYDTREALTRAKIT